MFKTLHSCLKRRRACLVMFKGALFVKNFNFSHFIVTWGCRCWRQDQKAEANRVAEEQKLLILTTKRNKSPHG